MEKQMADKPFAQSCENNKQVILEQLEKLIKKPTQLLEIGSGTGQHAVFFAERLPHINWQTSDQAEHHSAIKIWLTEAELENLQFPILLDVSEKSHWPQQRYQAVFTANTSHIMSWPQVMDMFEGVSQSLDEQGLFIQYGPFNKNGQFTSESNARFEQWLKNRGEHMGIRDLDELIKLADGLGLKLKQEIPMPANNFILVWER